MTDAVVRSPCPTNVTLAAPADESALMDLLRLRHEEDGIGSFDEIAVRAAVRQGIMRNWSYVGVIRENKELVASIGLFIGGFWYSSDSHLMDYWNFVAPSHRKSTYAKNLLLFAKWVSDELGRPLVMAKIENAATVQMVKLYERQLPRSGSLFVYNMPEQKGFA